MAASTRGHAKPTAAAKAYAIHGTRIDEPKAEKLSRAEKDRRQRNAELRKPKCLSCGRPRERRAALKCNACEGVS